MRERQNTGLAAEIERDLLCADDGKPNTAIECFACGRGVTYRASRFCSSRCRELFDAGNPSYEARREHQGKLENAPLRDFVVVAGPPGNPWESILDASGGGTPILRRGSNGFYIRCAGCKKEFESRGSRSCSIECERRYREREANIKLMAEVGIEPTKVKRQCVECGARIPTWRNGRKVSRATRFCSPKCAQKARRLQNVVLNANSIKKAA
jgi:hypothetical protein